MKEKSTIVIVGAGFGGIRAALDLEKDARDYADIILISDKGHFEFTPTLHRVVTGSSPLHVCIPLKEIFHNKNVKLIEDKICSVSAKNRTLHGKAGRTHKFDYLVLAIGSETTYFDIPGLKEHAFGFKSIGEALRLKKHLHEVFKNCEAVNQEERVCHAHFVIVGGGASGTEIAGDLAVHARELASMYNVDPSLVAIDLIEAGKRILKNFPESFSKKVEHRLRGLGVNIYTNRSIVKEDINDVYMKDMQMKTKTLIWAAGIRVNSLCEDIAGVRFDEHNRIKIDNYLCPEGEFERIFVVGDIASTPYTGMAQTAIYDGAYVARNITRILAGKSPVPYEPKKPAYIISINNRWAAAKIGSVHIYGILARFVRKAADFRFFLSILPPIKAIHAFGKMKSLCETCASCRVSKL